MEETLRVNGRAWLTRDPSVLGQLAGGGTKPPKVAIGVEVEEAFLHCAKAFKRSALWRPDEWPDTAGLAAAARIWRDHMALDMTTREVQEFVDDDYANNLTWQ
jgi:predicted pyridoxine 5'-phosphate oxidase superfamily flavin-nucleotide-binding protein